jgi:hypothetical protein
MTFELIQYSRGLREKVDEERENSTGRLLTLDSTARSPTWQSKQAGRLLIT